MNKLLVTVLLLLSFSITTFAQDEAPCYQLVFPITMIMPDGSTITGDNGPQLRRLHGEWMTDHQSTEITRDYQYPIELDFGDDKIKTINSAEEHKEVIDWCNSDKSEKTACFELVYPITMTMPDGSEITSEDAESFKTATGDWKKANPDKLEGEYSFNYPLDIVMGDELITIESDEDFEEAKLKCASEK